MVRNLTNTAHKNESQPKSQEDVYPSATDNHYLNRFVRRRLVDGHT